MSLEPDLKDINNLKVNFSKEEHPEVKNICDIQLIEALGNQYKSNVTLSFIIPIVL